MSPFGGTGARRDCTGQGPEIFVDELTRFAQQSADQRVKALAQRVASPLRVSVTGRAGVGCTRVAYALHRAGAASGVTIATAAPDLRVRVVAEVVKPEDTRDADAALLVLNKADVVRLSGDGNLAARCARAAELTGLPVLPMSGLLAWAALDDLDAQCWTALQQLAADPGGLSCLDGSYDGFLAAPLPVPVATRARLLAILDLLGVALTVAGLRQGAGPTRVRALLRRVSGVDGVLERLVAAGAEVRYRRVLAAVDELEVLAVSDPAVAAFLRRDETVIARMTAAGDAVAAEGLPAGPEAPLARALHWQRYRRTQVSALHKACAADIARGSLRLWSRAGGAALRELR